MSARNLRELVLATQPYAKEDRSKTWRLLAVTFGVAALFIAGAAYSELPLWLRGLSGFAAGWVLVRIFIFYHDFQHGALFEDSRLGAGLMNAFGVLILNPPNVWKRSHNYHHRYNSQIFTASIGSYPIMTLEDYRKASWSKRLGYRAARHPLNILFGYVTVFILGMCLKSFLTDWKRHMDSAVALVLHFVLLVSIWALAGWATAVFAFLMPIAVSCTLGGYLFYAQHNFPDMKLKNREHWDFGFAALRSSSFMDGGWLFHWLTGNIGYHHVHHLNHRIPFYRLPEAMAAVPELQSPGRTSLHPRDVAACLRLSLWDPASDRMLSGYPKSAGEFLRPGPTVPGTAH